MEPKWTLIYSAIESSGTLREFFDNEEGARARFDQLPDNAQCTLAPYLHSRDYEHFTAVRPLFEQIEKLKHIEQVQHQQISQVAADLLDAGYQTKVAEKKLTDLTKTCLFLLESYRLNSWQHLAQAILELEKKLDSLETSGIVKAGGTK